MKRDTKLLLIATVATIAFLLIPAMIQSPLTEASNLIASFEGFSPSPYWDVSRWSWGYGTPAPGPTGTITQEQALWELQTHSKKDYQYLQSIITRPLNTNQWAALLSFAYNEGVGNAAKLAANTNSGNDAALETEWNKYIYAGGVVNQSLIDRRAKEFAIWQS